MGDCVRLAASVCVCVCVVGVTGERALKQRDYLSVCCLVRSEASGGRRVSCVSTDPNDKMMIMFQRTLSSYATMHPSDTSVSREGGRTHVAPRGLLVCCGHWDWNPDSSAGSLFRNIVLVPSVKIITFPFRTSSQRRVEQGPAAARGSLRERMTGKEMSRLREGESETMTEQETERLKQNDGKIERKCGRERERQWSTKKE